jgi:deoxyuridine 5'-triphosphate nucleotidohydrolase
MDTAYIFGVDFGKDPDVETDDRTRYTLLSLHDKLMFWRGYFDVHGVVRREHEDGQYVCKLHIEDMFLQNEFINTFNIPFIKYMNMYFHIHGINCLEFLHTLYDNAPMSSNANIQAYHTMLYDWKPSNMTGVPKCKFMKTLSNAYIPTKAHVSDSGYDLQLVEYVKTVNGVDFFDTGISIQPPMGFYFELVARSSLTKTGYVLANSIGIIDASYTGSIKVALMKVCKEAPNIQLPARLVQLIPRRFIHLQMEETTNFDKTQRDTGGFGSSDSNHE